MNFISLLFVPLLLGITLAVSRNRILIGDGWNEYQHDKKTSYAYFPYPRSLSYAQNFLLPALREEISNLDGVVEIVLGPGVESLTSIYGGYKPVLGDSNKVSREKMHGKGGGDEWESESGKEQYESENHVSDSEGIKSDSERDSEKDSEDTRVVLSLRGLTDSYESRDDEGNDDDDDDYDDDDDGDSTTYNGAGYAWKDSTKLGKVGCHAIQDSEYSECHRVDLAGRDIQECFRSVLSKNLSVMWFDSSVQMCKGSDLGGCPIQCDQYNPSLPESRDDSPGKFDHKKEKQKKKEKKKEKIKEKDEKKKEREDEKKEEEKRDEKKEEGKNKEEENKEEEKKEEEKKDEEKKDEEKKDKEKKEEKKEEEGAKNGKENKKTEREEDGKNDRKGSEQDSDGFSSDDLKEVERTSNVTSGNDIIRSPILRDEKIVNNDENLWYDGDDYSRILYPSLEKEKFSGPFEYDDEEEHRVETSLYKLKDFDSENQISAMLEALVLIPVAILDVNGGLTAKLEGNKIHSVSSDIDVEESSSQQDRFDNSDSDNSTTSSENESHKPRVIVTILAPVDNLRGACGGNAIPAESEETDETDETVSVSEERCVQIGANQLVLDGPEKFDLFALNPLKYALSLVGLVHGIEVYSRTRKSLDAYVNLADEVQFEEIVEDFTRKEALTDWEDTAVNWVAQGHHYRKKLPQESDSESIGALTFVCWVFLFCFAVPTAVALIFVFGKKACNWLTKPRPISAPLLPGPGHTNMMDNEDDSVLHHQRLEGGDQQSFLSREVR